MSGYKGASAIVTGAGSGIGLALSREMIARGAQVWMTDVNADAVQAAAAELGSAAHADTLDVRDADAFSSLALQVHDETDGLDFLFNNAGIGVGGEVQQLRVEHFDRIIDINIRGVTNGVVAAYPLMVQRGRGHIVNTASAGGLMAMPLAAPYSMTKHAVVGLTNSMRYEGEHYGVRVSALCPSAIETPILDTDGPEDLAQPAWRPDIRRYLTRLAGPPQPADAFAKYALDEVAANTGIIVMPRRARIARQLNRFFPGFVQKQVRAAFAAEMADRPPLEAPTNLEAR